MNVDNSKIDKDLKQTLDHLNDQDEIDVLLYYKNRGDGIKKFLQSGKEEKILDYNILDLANCIVVQAPKRIIMQLVERDDITRMAMNPKFTAGT